MYYIYILRCSDNSLYTGITTDLNRRVSEHFYQKKQCAKYTKSHKVTVLEAVWSVDDKPSALKCEIKIKNLSKKEKEMLIKSTDDIGLCKRIKSIKIEDCI